MAKAINEDGQLFPEWALSAAFSVAGITAIVLVCLLWSAYRTRRRAERHADEHFKRLIERRPELFLPRAGGR
jgi:heme/copper-type cytochrome/quinol oxidase subunit 2